MAHLCEVGSKVYTCLLRRGISRHCQPLLFTKSTSVESAETNFRSNLCTNIIYRSFASVEKGQPIQFSKSKAAAWTSSDSFGPPPAAAPRVQVYSVIFSTAALLIYFCVLREENDLDDELNATLYERLPGLELQQLQVAILHNEKNNLDTTELKKRLAELEGKS